MNAPFDVSVFYGPVLVTGAYFVLWYYLLLIVQRGVKYKLKEEYESAGKVFDRYFTQDERMLAADRAVINTQEQMVPFLIALWLHATFVSPFHATVLGSVYLVLRSIYPFLLGSRVSKLQSKRVYFVTLPSYLIIFYMIAGVIWAAL